jgi:hypothetical protein
VRQRHLRVGLDELHKKSLTVKRVQSRQLDLSPAWNGGLDGGTGKCMKASGGQNIAKLIGHLVTCDGASARDTVTKADFAHSGSAVVIPSLTSDIHEIKTRGARTRQQVISNRP